MIRIRFRPAVFVLLWLGVVLLGPQLPCCWAYDPSPLRHSTSANPAQGAGSLSSSSSTTTTSSNNTAPLDMTLKKNGGDKNRMVDKSKPSKTLKNGAPSTTATPASATTTTTTTSNKTPIRKTKAATAVKRRTAKRALTPEESASLRRIQSEWRDIVQAGMAFNWKSQKPVLPKTAASSSSSSSRQPSADETPAMTAATTTSVKPHHIWVGPVSKNLWTWHFSFQGIPGTPFEGGIYHGRIVLPKNYPSSPPRVQVLTPSGRFVPGADICLSASHFHPETWTAAWTVRTLVESLRLHMLTTANEIGGMEASYAQRVSWARASRSWRATLVVGRPSSVVVNHAHMLQGGLFPSVAKEEGENEDDVKQNYKSHGAVDAEEDDDDDDDEQLEDAEARATANEESSRRYARMRDASVELEQQEQCERPTSSLLALFKSPLRVALLSLCLLFVVLNTT